MTQLPLYLNLEKLSLFFLLANNVFCRFYIVIKSLMVPQKTNA